MKSAETVLTTDQKNTKSPFVQEVVEGTKKKINYDGWGLLDLVFEIVVTCWGKRSIHPCIYSNCSEVLMLALFLCIVGYILKHFH